MNSWFRPLFICTLITGCAGKTFIEPGKGISEHNKQSFAIVEWKKGNFNRADVEVLSIDGQQTPEYGRAALTPGSHEIQYRCRLGDDDFSKKKPFNLEVESYTITALTAVNVQGECSLIYKVCAKGERMYFINLSELVCESERPENLEFAGFGEHFLL